MQMLHLCFCQAQCDRLGCQCYPQTEIQNEQLAVCRLWSDILLHLSASMSDWHEYIFPYFQPILQAINISPDHLYVHIYKCHRLSTTLTFLLSYQVHITCLWHENHIRTWLSWLRVGSGEYLRLPSQCYQIRSVFQHLLVVFVVTENSLFKPEHNLFLTLTKWCVCVKHRVVTR